MIGLYAFANICHLICNRTYLLVYSTEGNGDISKADGGGSPDS